MSFPHFAGGPIQAIQFCVFVTGELSAVIDYGWDIKLDLSRTDFFIFVTCPATRGLQIPGLEPAIWQKTAGITRQYRENKTKPLLLLATTGGLYVIGRGRKASAADTCVVSELAAHTGDCDQTRQLRTESPAA